MRVSISVAAVCLGMFLCVNAARAADQIDNPRFHAWSKFAVGSSETVDGSIDTPQAKITMETVYTLTEKADDHVTLDVTVTTTFMGQQHTNGPTKQNVAAKINKDDITQLDNEKVDAAGKTFDCKVYQVNMQVANNPDPNSKAKVWVSEDVPGGMVKVEATSQRGTMTQLLKSYEAK